MFLARMWKKLFVFSPQMHVTVCYKYKLMISMCAIDDDGNDDEVDEATELLYDLHA